mgnify:CR=1 FL=1
MKTPTWQLSTLPRWLHHWRFTPTECMPRLGKLRGFVANFAQKVMTGQLPLSVRRLRGERVELFGCSEALFPSLNHHLFFLDHVHEFDPN